MDELSRQKRVVFPLTDAATVTVDASKGDIFVHEGSVARTIDGPTGGYDGQIIEIRSKNTGGGAITHTLDVAGADSFRFKPGFSALNPIPAGIIAEYVAQYHAGDEKWELLDDSLGASGGGGGGLTAAQAMSRGLGC